jgi:hypothetical protein
MDSPSDAEAALAVGARAKAEAALAGSGHGRDDWQAGVMTAVLTAASGQDVGLLRPVPIGLTRPARR